MRKLVLNIKILFCRAFKKPLFILKIEDGQVIKVKGIIKSGFMADCMEIIQRNNLQLGLIYAIKGEYGKPVLKISSEIPKDILQQLRNVWSFN